jgi:hypothetical protein
MSEPQDPTVNSPTGAISTLGFGGILRNPISVTRFPLRQTVGRPPSAHRARELPFSAAPIAASCLERIIGAGRSIGRLYATVREGHHSVPGLDQSWGEPSHLQRDWRGTSSGDQQHWRAIAEALPTQPDPVADRFAHATHGAQIARSGLAVLAPQPHRTTP